MAHVPTGDSGKWNTDSAELPRMTLRERGNTLPYIASPAQMAAMKAEDAFVASVASKFPTKRFTDRRKMPGRNRETP